MLPDYIINRVALAEAEPKILLPCDTTIWIIGDSAIVSWQGASLTRFGLSGLETDSILYFFKYPSWRYAIELYRNGEFVKNVTSSGFNRLPAIVCSDSTDRGPGFIMGGSPPRVNVNSGLGQCLLGAGYQIRVVSVSIPSVYGLLEPVEMWSDPFEIVEPWLDIVIPNASTVWREDSSDVFIQFIRHGSFGYRYPNILDSYTYLVKNDSLVERIFGHTQFHQIFSNGELTIPVKVRQEWGNGDGFRIYIEVRNGMKFYSDYFSIYGQTIDINLPSLWNTHVHGNLQFEWTPSSGETITIDLYELSQDGMAFVEVLASDIINEGYYISGDSINIDWVGKHFRIKVEDSDGNYGWSEHIYFSSVVAASSGLPFL